jgi:hypothetical protein
MTDDYRARALKLIGPITKGDARREPIKQGNKVVGWHNGKVMPEMQFKVFAAAQRLKELHSEYLTWNEAQSIAYSAFWRTWKDLVGQE